jgi:hypothetical protein
MYGNVCNLRFISVCRPIVNFRSHFSFTSCKLVHRSLWEEMHICLVFSPVWYVHYRYDRDVWIGYSQPTKPNKNTQLLKLTYTTTIECLDGKRRRRSLCSCPSTRSIAPSCMLNWWLTFWTWIISFAWNRYFIAGSWLLESKGRLFNSYDRAWCAWCDTCVRYCQHRSTSIDRQHHRN